MAMNSITSHSSVKAIGKLVEFQEVKLEMLRGLVKTSSYITVQSLYFIQKVMGITEGF